MVFYITTLFVRSCKNNFGCGFVFEYGFSFSRYLRKKVISPVKKKEMFVFCVFIYNKLASNLSCFKKDA